MIERIAIAILTRLGTWLYARALKKVNEELDAAAEKRAAEQRVQAEVDRIKAAYKEAFNGQPVSKEQRAKLNQSIADFVRGVPAKPPQG